MTCSQMLSPLLRRLCVTTPDTASVSSGPTGSFNELHDDTVCHSSGHQQCTSEKATDDDLRCTKSDMTMTANAAAPMGTGDSKNTDSSTDIKSLANIDPEHQTEEKICLHSIASFSMYKVLLGMFLFNLFISITLITRKPLHKQ